MDLSYRTENIWNSEEISAKFFHHIILVYSYYSNSWGPTVFTDFLGISAGKKQKTATRWALTWRVGKPTKRIRG